jgi:hypothetical protein
LRRAPSGRAPAFRLVLADPGQRVMQGPDGSIEAMTTIAHARASSIKGPLRGISGFGSPRAAMKLGRGFLTPNGSCKRLLTAL